MTRQDQDVQTIVDNKKWQHILLSYLSKTLSVCQAGNRSQAFRSELWFANQSAVIC